MLNDKNLTLNNNQLKRSRNCIKLILDNHLTKYNYQPIVTPEIGSPEKKKILVVDQSFGDMSITMGKATEKTFEKMLEAAIYENPDSDIIVKTHPDTTSGGRSGYYNILPDKDNVFKYTNPINPISLINYSDKVYVCTTQFGFEALMCNKEVHVFGMPFYAGWGLTKDFQKCERRNNKRTVEELFYITYIMYSYYVNPVARKKCEIEEAMNYLIQSRKLYFEG